MNIFNTTQSTTPSKDAMIADSNTGLNSLITMTEHNFYFLNNSSNPQAILDEWGTSAVSLFQAYAATIAFIQNPLIRPTYIAPVTKNTYTINADGTVTWNKPA